MGILHQEGGQWVLKYDEKMFKLVLDRVLDPLFPVVPVPVPFPVAVSLPAYHVETWFNSLVPFPYMVMLRDFLWDFDVTSCHLWEI